MSIFFKNLTLKLHCLLCVYNVPNIYYLYNLFCSILLFIILQDFTKQRRQQFRSQQIQVTDENTIG